MGAISNHYGDISNWIGKTIKSCKTQEQTFAVDKLIKNFQNKLISKSPSDYCPNQYYDIIKPLKAQLECKRENL